MVFGGGHCDIAIRQCHIEQGEEPCVLPKIIVGLASDIAGDATPFQRGAFPPEQCDCGLVVSSARWCIDPIAAK